MAGPLINITINGDNKGAIAALDGTNQRMQAFSQTFSKAAATVEGAMKSANESLNRMAQAAAGYLGITAMRGFVNEAVKAREAFGLLDQAMKSSGQYSEEYRQELAAQQEALAAKTKLQAEDVALVQQRLVTMGVERGMMAQATQATIDYAQAIGVNAVEAAQQLGNAMSGDVVGSIRKFKIEIDETKPKADQLRQLFSQLSTQVHGQAEAAYAVAPAWFAMGKALNDFKQDLGGLALDSGILDGLNSLLKTLRELPQWLQQSALVAGGLSSAFLVIQGVVAVIGPAFVALKGAITPVITALGAWAAGLTEGGALAWGFTLAGVVAAFVAAKKAIDLAISSMRLWNALSEKDSAEAQAKVADLELLADLREKINSSKDDGTLETKDAEMYLEILNQQTRAILKGEMQWDSYHERLLSVARSVERLVVKQKQLSEPMNATALSSAVEAAYESGYARLAKTQLDIELSNLETLYAKRGIADADYLAKKQELTRQQYEWEFAQSIAESDAIAAQKLRIESDPSIKAKDKANQVDALAVKLVELQYNREIILQKAKQAGIAIDEDAARIKISNAERVAAAYSRQFEAERAALEIQTQQVDGNWRATEDEKLSARLPLLEKQIELDQQEVDTWNSLASAFEVGTEARQKYEDLAQQAQRKLESDWQARVNAGNVPDPNSMMDQLTLRFVAMRQQWGSMARSMADVISNTVTSAVGGLSDAITNVIFTTKDAGAAFMALGQQVLSTLVNMTIKALLFRGVMALTGGFLGFADGGAIAGYASGGPITQGTGPRSDDVLIRASRGEYVINAAAAGYYGKGLLDAINTRALDARTFASIVPRAAAANASGCYANGGAVAAGVPTSPNVNVLPTPVVVVNTQQQLREFAEKHGNQMALEYIRANRHKLGIRS